MIQLSNITLRFGGQLLFENISLSIANGERIGLTGKNGAGKSSLMKIIGGMIKSSSGQLHIPQKRTVGYLPQELPGDISGSVLELAMSAFSEKNELEDELKTLEQRLAEETAHDSPAYHDMIGRMTEIHERLNVMDAVKTEGDAVRMLKGLGFADDELGKKISELSGEWKMRVLLARLLLQSPDLLMLDEPTNHLDIESIIWLESWLKSYRGAIVMISHDRRFLDQITQRTIELVNGTVYDYPVSYSKYEQLRMERLQQQEAAFKNQQQYIATQERFIERFRAKNTKASQVQSRVKRLERLERVQFDELDTGKLKLRFPPAPRSGDIVFNSRDLGKSFGSKCVLKKLNLELRRGERVAIMGRNGTGKTTLVKILTGKLDHEGSLRTGHNVHINYYAQENHAFNPKSSVYEVIENAATGEWAKTTAIRSLLGAFLFGADDIDKPVKVLSGGEKSRLALARMLLLSANLLILDEPTNHLDMSAKAILKQALMQYNGTLLIVSHDRSFLHGLCQRSWVFERGTVQDKLGDPDEVVATWETPVKPKAETKKKPGKAGMEWQKKKQLDSAIRKCRKEIARLEKRIDKLDGELSVIEQSLADPASYDDKEQANNLIWQHKELKQKQELTMAAWEKASKDLEQLEEGKA